LVELSTVALGSEHDAQIIKLLALTPMTATRLGKELQVDDGALTIHLFKLQEDGLVKIVDADGPNPVWDLTEKGRKHREQVGYP
jgi:predicted ArsR family transcriptional regulator